MNHDNPISVLAPFFEQRPNRLIPGLPFADYQAIPAANSSLLKNATAFEQLGYVVGSASLGAYQRALVALTGAARATMR